MPAGSPGFDALGKVRPLITLMRHSFLDSYTPKENVSVDEGSCPWRGRLKWRVYNPSKPNKFHMKLFEVCESESGYVIGFDIYTGSTECAQYAEGIVDEEMNTTTKVVVGLLAYCGLLEKGYRVFMDNNYTSPELFTLLEVHGTLACGTVRKNRVGLPKALGVTKLRQGQGVFSWNGPLLALKFHIKQNINMLSTIHDSKCDVYRPRDRARNPNDHLMKPTCIVQYIKRMGGVDLAEQTSAILLRIQEDTQILEEAVFLLG